MARRGLKNSVFASLASGLGDGVRALEDALPIAGIARLGDLAIIEPIQKINGPTEPVGNTKAQVS